MCVGLNKRNSTIIFVYISKVSRWWGGKSKGCLVEGTLDEFHQTWHEVLCRCLVLWLLWWMIIIFLALTGWQSPELVFLGLLSLICLCKWHFNASEEMHLNNIRITGRERGDSVWWGHHVKTSVCVCVCVQVCDACRRACVYPVIW